MVTPDVDVTGQNYFKPKQKVKKDIFFPVCRTCMVTPDVDVTGQNYF